MDPPGDDDGGATGAGAGRDDVPLDPDAITMLAAEEHWEMVYYSKESRLISFQPVVVVGAADNGHWGDDDDDDDDGGAAHDDDEGVIIDVHWATGRVGIRHPAREKAGLLRRNAAYDDLVDIFRNPPSARDADFREDAPDRHEGPTGHDEDGPDGAGAAPYDENGDHVVDSPHDVDGDGDHLVDSLQETNRMLREQLDKSQMIEVTGPRGDPVYAAGSFRDGSWTLERGAGGRLWEVELEMAREADDDGSEIMELPILALDDVEIRIGGVVYASARSHRAYAHMEPRDWDDENRKEVPCRFGGPIAGAWLPVRIDRWPEADWSAVRDREAIRGRSEYREDLDVYGVLLEDVSRSHPDATLSFHVVKFLGEAVEGMAENLGLAAPRSRSWSKPEGGPDDKEEEDDDDEGDKELWNIANLIVATLRTAGNDDVGDRFMRRVNDLQMGAYMMLAVNGDSRDAVENEVPTLVEMQLSSSSTSEFLSWVQTRYGIRSFGG